MGNVKVTGFRMDDKEVTVEGTEGKTIKEVAKEIGLDMSGRLWIVNGNRIAESEAADTRVHGGDTVRTAAKNDQGSTNRTA